VERDPPAVPLRIRLPYGTEEEFIEGYGTNVAASGVFIATRSFKPTGTVLQFEFVLAGGSRLLRGEGMVIQTQVDEGGGRSGMTVRFTRLDAASKALVDRVLAARSGTPPQAPEPVSPVIAALPAETPPTDAADVAPAEAPPAEAPPAEAPPVDAALVDAASADAAPADAAPADAAPADAAPADAAPADAAPAHAHLADAPTVDGPAADTAPAEAPRADVAVAETTLSEIPSSVSPPAAERRPPRPIASPAEPRRASPQGDDVLLGIDLGTTSARCAAVIDGVPRLLPLTPDGRTFFIPSVVALVNGDRLVVGEEAKAQLLVDAGRTVSAPKRLLGRRARSAQIRAWAARLPYAVVADADGDAAVELGGAVYPLPEIVSHLLAALKVAAQEHLGRAVRRAILCAPAYFTHPQRSALLRAGHLAGLEVVRIFNEPTAVALAYGHGRGLARKRVLVYDLGGGSFDASVVQITGNDLEVVATGGDVFLGGMDFDDRLVDALRRESGHAEPGAAPLELQHLRVAAERAKIVLSEVERTPVQLPWAFARAELDRGTLEKLTADLVDRTVDTTRAVLHAANLAPGSLDEVLMVGGQSLAPLVRRRVEEALGRPGCPDVDPLGAVALGAAILGDALVRAEKGRGGVRLSEILSLPIGIALRDGSMRRVLDRRTPLPAEKTLSIPVSAGAPVGIAVFQGEAAVADENEYLGSLSLTAERGGEASLRFRVNADGTLQLAARGPGLGQETVLATGDAADPIRSEIVRSAPLPGDGHARAVSAGLFGGIKRLFGRR
jgi:molecular chaperone DnaK